MRVVRSPAGEAEHRDSDRVIHDVRVSEDGTRAVVQMTETWSSEFRQNGTDLCLGRIARSELPRTLQLVRGGSGSWLVASVEMPVVNDEPQPCYTPVP